MSTYVERFRDEHPEEWAAAEERYADLKARAAERRKRHAATTPRQDSSDAPLWMRDAQFRTEAWTRA